MTFAHLDVREGGTYRIRFRKLDGQELGVSGTYLEVVEGRRLSFSWAWQGTPERVSRVTLDITPVEGGTELAFVHDRFADRQARLDHERGWAGPLDKLGRYIEGAGSGTP